MAAEIQVISIVGPTAVGKTELALELAELVDGEIVSLDAYQIYRGMDIGTAKASLQQRERVPHHLVDVLDIQELATVSDFSQWAATAIKQIHSKDKIAICVGGSGLYVQSVLEVLDIPPTDLDIRAKYEKLLLEVGEVELHKQLQAIDPVAAEVISVANSRRVVRALEVNEVTGEPFPSQIKQSPQRYVDLRVGLGLDKSFLANRISGRVEEMFRLDWESEVATLVEQGLLQTPTAVKAIGYREVAALLAGEVSKAETVSSVIQATTRYAKRQMSWFRRDSKIQWFDREEFSNAQVLEEIKEKLQIS
jgi:tRNA dimethylallyltransferase